jgi:hypothetical protein
VVGAQMSSTVCACGRCDGLRRVCWGVGVGGGGVGARKYHLQRADVGGWAVWVGWWVGGGGVGGWVGGKKWTGVCLGGVGWVGGGGRGNNRCHLQRADMRACKNIAGEATCWEEVA